MQIGSLGQEDSPGESHGQRSLVGYSPYCLKESDMTEATYTHTHTHTHTHISILFLDLGLGLFHCLPVISFRCLPRKLNRKQVLLMCVKEKKV